MKLPDDFICETTRPDTKISKVIRTHEEYVKEKDFYEDEKYMIGALIARLEQDLIYYSRDGMELRSLPNTVEDIIHDLKIVYKYRNKVYCSTEKKYIKEPSGLRYAYKW